jgi:hypothetical protein
MLDMLEGVGQEQHCTEMLKYIKTHGQAPSPRLGVQASILLVLHFC